MNPDKIPEVGELIIATKDNTKALHDCLNNNEILHHVSCIIAYSYVQLNINLQREHEFYSEKVPKRVSVILFKFIQDPVREFAPLLRARLDELQSEGLDATINNGTFENINESQSIDRSLSQA